MYWLLELLIWGRDWGSVLATNILSDNYPIVLLPASASSMGDQLKKQTYLLLIYLPYSLHN